MNRQEYLQLHWQRYPSAKEDWLSVADAAKLSQIKKGEKIYICGRIMRIAENSQIILEWNGQQMEVTLAKPVADLFSNLPEFCLNHLVVGDLVCVAVWLSDRLVDFVTEKEHLTPGYDLRGASCLAKAFVVNQIGLIAPSHLSFRNPVHSQFDQQIAQQWDRFLFLVREHFLREEFVELRTPSLVPSPGTEPFLMPFVTELKSGSQTRSVYLPTSPEFHMKRALVGGWDRIFEIKTCYRNDEQGDHHQCEFVLLEWYRAFSNLEKIGQDLQKLLKKLSKELALPKEFSASPEIRILSFTELFAMLDPTFIFQPQTNLATLQAWARSIGMHHSAQDTWDELFLRFVVDRFEPMLQSMGPVIVWGYPPSQQAFAKIRSDGWADRFEFYWNGLEIANAFHELNDPDENFRCQSRDLEKKRMLQVESVPLDSGLLEAIQMGMPPASGIAVGLERLFMALTGRSKIQSIRAFPIYNRQD